MSDDALRALMERRSVRSWEPGELEGELKDRVIAATLRAPTAGNMMLYSVLEIEDQGLKDRLAVTCDDQPFIAKAPWLLVFVADWQRWTDYFELSGVRELCAERGLEYSRPREADLFLAIDDALIAAQTAAVAAEALGLGCCYVGDVMENYETHRELLGLPRYAFPAAMLCVGRPAGRRPEGARVPRFDRRHIVFRNRYERRSAADFAQMFGTEEYRRRALLPGAANFGQHMYLRKTAAAFSEEMRRSVRAALADWA